MWARPARGLCTCLPSQNGEARAGRTHRRRGCELTPAGCPGAAPSFTMLLEVTKAEDNSREEEGHSELGQVQIRIRAIVLEAVPRPGWMGQAH